MIIKGREVRINPNGEPIVVFDNHIEIPIDIAKEDIDFLSSEFGIDKEGDCKVSLLVKLDEGTANINNVTYIHILDSYIHRTDNYNSFLDKLFKEDNYSEIDNLAERCMLSITEKIELLAQMLPKAN